MPNGKPTMDREEIEAAIAALDAQMDEIIWINLGGGSASYKSHLAETLEGDYPGEVMAIREVATCLLEGRLVPKPGRDIKYSLPWQALFQGAVVGAQIPVNRLWAMVAIERGFKIIATDRTDWNGGDFWPDGHLPFCHMFGINTERALKRIRVHFHCQSLSVYNPKAYEMNPGVGNGGRFEPTPDSQALCHRAWRGWKSLHPRCVFVPGDKRAHRRIELVERHVNLLLQGDNDGLARLVAQYSEPPERFREFYDNEFTA